MNIVSYGGGTNSTAMLVGLHERGERPDAIVFADTGSEKPHTYEHLLVVSEWCAAHGFPAVETIRGQQPQMLKDGSLEAECIRLGALPSKAHGYSTCSLKWKIEPQRKHYRALAEARALTLDGVTVLIGFDADEETRVARGKDAYKAGDYRQEFPLFDWGWAREECVEAIDRAGLTQPGKSACFFCPSTKKAELLVMRERYPDLLARALEMERRALAGEGQATAFEGAGLGRSFNWRKFLADWDAAEERERDFLNRLAVRVRRGGLLRRSAHRRDPPPPYPRKDHPAPRQGSRQKIRHPEADPSAHPAPQFRHSPAGVRLRHPHRAGTARPCRREHHHDLYPRAQPRWARSNEPAGQNFVTGGIS